MRVRLGIAGRYAGLLTTLVAFASAATAAVSEFDTRPAKVYGLELETRAERERLLVFGSRPLRYRLVDRDARTVELHVERATLDPSAPTHVAPGIGRSVVWVRAGEEAGDVVITITRSPGRAPEVSARGSMIAVDFPGLAVKDGPVALQFRDAEIADVVRAVSDVTGVAFVFDPELDGRITIAVGDPVSAPEALELLDSALLLLGHAALPTPSGARKIVPIASSAFGAQWKPDVIGDSDRLATTLVRLDSAKAAELATALQPWLGEAAVAIPVEPTNSLILAGAESHLQHILTSVRALDEATREDLLVRRLRHRTAEDMAEFVREWARGAPGRHPLEAWSIPRNDTLVVRASVRDMPEIRSFVERLDRARVGSGGFQAIAVRERDAGEVATLLDGLADDLGPLAGRDYAVSVYAATNALLVRADPETTGVIARLVDELDRAPRQIRVELKLLEVTTPKSLRLALDAFWPFASPGSRSLNALLLAPSSAGQLAKSSALRGSYVRAPLLIPFVDENGMPSLTVLPRETVIVTADQRQVHTRVMMKPELLMISGQEHELFAGNVIPIPTAAQGESVLLETNRSIERRDVGLRLRLLPTVTDAGGVRLELDLDVSSLLPSLAGDAALVGPTIRQRRLTSVIQLQGNEFAVIGLGEESTTQYRERGVPFLKDVPALGIPFRRTDDAETVSRLILAVSAHTVKTTDERHASSIQHGLAAERQRSRQAALSTGGDDAFAVRAASRRVEDDALLIAELLRARGEDARVLRVRRTDGEFFEVYLHGFHSLFDAASASLRLAGPLYDPEVVPLSARDPRLAGIRPQPATAR